MKRTKIVCTIGPVSEAPATLEKMMRAGMNVCRLNMSHGTYEWHAGAIKKIRAAAKKVGEPIAILLDLQGPKVRLGEVSSQKSVVRVGERVVFMTSPIRHPERSEGSRTNVRASARDSSASDLRMTSPIPIALPNFHKYVKKGAHLLIADGTIECVVEEVRGHDIVARVTLGGELKSHKGIAVQGVSLPLPPLTAKDKKDITWSRGQDIDFVALSFVKKAGDVESLRRLLVTKRRNSSLSDGIGPAIIVKIETREAVKNFDSILEVADGVMIARGDLALATSPEEVPIFQKEIIEKCRRAGKPVIVATEMLASMERSPRPTRAEASDVANAVIDHTDATMLSSESATGAYPVETVSMMAHIIKKAERSRFDDLSIGGEIFPHPSPLPRGDGDRVKALSPRERAAAGRVREHGEEETALTASVLARTSGAKAIVAGSRTGHTGRLLSRYRTEVLLLMGSPDLRVVHQLNLSWGVRPFLMPSLRTVDALQCFMIQQARKSGLKRGSKVVLLGSEKIAPHGQSVVGIKTL